MLSKILSARDKRAFLRQSISKENKASISLTLNIPGIAKSNELITSFFTQILSELQIYLTAHRIFIDKKKQINTIDAAGNFFLVPLICKTKEVGKTKYLKNLKLITEEFETSHKVGRFIDIDITNFAGEAVSSRKNKLCFFCKEQPAIYCMRDKRHSFAELRNYFLSEIKKYLKSIQKKETIRKISSTALKSILYEVSLSPKPGLVDFESSGSHTDMNYYTFIDSSSVLSSFFTQTATAGYEFSDDLSKALPVIRTIGLKSEEKMFEATHGANTQKGLIFLMGLTVFSIAYMEAQEMKICSESFSKITSSICHNIIDNELVNNTNRNSTHGEKCFSKYGNIAGGARLEAQNGFPTVIKFALPVLSENLFLNSINKKEIINIALQKTLIAIIAKNNDTNILFRGGEGILNELQNRAEKTLYSDNFHRDYEKLTVFCSKNNISPGGSADLLAITIFLRSSTYFME